MAEGVQNRLLEAVRNYNPDDVKRALEEGANVNGHRYERNYDGCPLIETCTRGYMDIVKILLENENINLHIRNDMALKMAAFKGYRDVVELLLRNMKEPFEKVGGGNNILFDPFTRKVAVFARIKNYRIRDLLGECNVKETYDSNTDDPLSLAILKHELESAEGFVNSMNDTALLKDGLALQLVNEKISQLGSSFLISEFKKIRGILEDRYRNTDKETPRLEWVIDRPSI